MGKRRMRRGRKRRTSAGEGIFFARNTMDPQYDVERNWSAWMSPQADTREGAIEAEMDVNPSANAEELDVRYHKSAKKWMIFHHEGLAGYTLRSKTLEEARKEARENEYPWYGTGHTTRGRVEYIEPVSGDLHLFWAEDSGPEPQ